MCAGSTRAEPPTRLQGRVERRTVDPGSKSEHAAIVLVGEDGSVWKLRRLGGNPFRDPVLDALAGQCIAAEGRVEGASFFLSGWTVLPD